MSQARREKVQCDKEMARMWEERRVFSVEGVIFLIFYLIGRMSNDPCVDKVSTINVK